MQPSQSVGHFGKSKLIDAQVEVLEPHGVNSVLLFVTNFNILKL